MRAYDVLIVGGGIVGLATACVLSGRFPGKRVAIVEKEAGLARHQTGHNSGVLHSGIYYRPGSMKAATCLAGREAMIAFCEREGVTYRVCGKVIVGVDEADQNRLEALYRQGIQNRVPCQLLSSAEFRELEPHAAGVSAILVHDTGIVDFRQVCARLAERVQESGHEIITRMKVEQLIEQQDKVVIRTNVEDFEARIVVNCAGLFSDRVAAFSGSKPTAKIVPFRGEYYMLKPEAKHLCRNLIYPMPDPQFPFLGVHFTRTIDDIVECGPNAVLAFAREGYRKTDLNAYDLAETITYPGFLRLARRHFRMGLGEMWRSWNKAAFVRALQRLIPEISAEHLETAPAGVRAQAITPDGKLLDDFALAETRRVVHVVNAPSPAATASLSIGKRIVDRLALRF